MSELLIAEILNICKFMYSDLLVVDVIDIGIHIKKI